jgi:hypothetical protein
VITRPTSILHRDENKAKKDERTYLEHMERLKLNILALVPK